MFSQKVMGVAARGVRFNSTNAYVAKATGFMSSISNKTSSTIKCATYWSKVVAELGKQIYVKEGYAPPAGAQFKQVFNELKQQSEKLFHKYQQNPQHFVDHVKGFNKQDALKYGAITIQLFGMFSLGEIIGRRHLVDYPKH